MDVEAFIPPVESPRSTELAIKTCHTCLEAGACRDFAVRAGPYLFGVWGGTTSSERAGLRKYATMVTIPLEAEVGPSDSEELLAGDLAEASSNGHALEADLHVPALRGAAR